MAKQAKVKDVPLLLRPESLKETLESLPQTPGVYLFQDKRGKPLYIGKAVSIRKRVLSHFRYFGEPFSKEVSLLSQVAGVDFIQTPTEADALLLEASLIKECQPKYNQELKDDKSYPFLKITAEEFPRLLVVRGRKPDGARYFGPYTSAYLLRKAVAMLRRLFPMRTCHPIPAKVCLMYHIGQCKGPCVDEIDKTRYQEIVKGLVRFLEGHRETLFRIKSLQQLMKEYSEKREYERAKSVYEEIKALSSLPQVGAGSKPALLKGANVLHHIKDVLSLPRVPLKIEGFDISNIQGADAVGSLVVFKNGKPFKSEYRRFKIKTVAGIDDYEMMREVVRRRYTRLVAEKKSLPDLVVIDGGKGHLAAVVRTIHELPLPGLKDLPIISIAKEHEHLFLPWKEGPTVLPQNSPVLQTLQHLRNEAHRFAIGYHRKLHRKSVMRGA